MLSRMQTHISVASPPLPQEHRRGRSEVNDSGHNIGVDFAFHAPFHKHSSPQAAHLQDVEQIGVAVSPPLPERNSSRGVEKNVQGREQRARYESVGWSDELGSEDEDLRRLGRARTS